MDCNKKITVTHLRDYPIDSLDTIPDYFLAEREVEEESTGNIKDQIVRIAGNRLFPNGNMDNVTGVPANNSSLVVPDNQVRACRMVNESNQITMYYADASHKAQFLAVGQVSDTTLIQNSGFVNIPGGHSYIIGVQYYTGSNGAPTTDNTSGQRLFIPITQTKLAVNMSY